MARKRKPSPDTAGNPDDLTPPVRPRPSHSDKFVVQPGDWEIVVPEPAGDALHDPRLVPPPRGPDRPDRATGPGTSDDVPDREQAQAPLPIEWAKQYRDTGYAILEVKVAGHLPLTFTSEWKPSLRQAGIIPLDKGDPGARRVRFGIPGEPGVFEVTGTTDRRLVAILEHFCRICDTRGMFHAGPVVVPDLEDLEP
jgi:hypothetical protein